MATPLGTWAKLDMIGTCVISLSAEPPYRLYEGDHWDSKRPFLETKSVGYTAKEARSVTGDGSFVRIDNKKDERNEGATFGSAISTENFGDSTSKHKREYDRAVTPRKEYDVQIWKLKRTLVFVAIVAVLGLKSVLVTGCQEAHWKAGHKLKCKEFKLNSSQTARSNFGFKPSGGGIKSFSSIALAPACGVSNSKPIKKPGKEDAHEFMRFAIDTMKSVCLDEFGEEKAVEPASQETTIIQHIFGGRLQSQVICAKCNKISNQFENMMGLTVEIHGDAASLEECLDQFTDKEWLHGENMYKCDRCNNYVKAWKRLTIQRAPNVLTIALKRFQRGRYGKLNKRVTFPEMMSEGEMAPMYTSFMQLLSTVSVRPSCLRTIEPSKEQQSIMKVDLDSYTKNPAEHLSPIKLMEPHNFELSFSVLDGDRLPRSNALYSTSYGDGIGASNIPYDPDVPKPGNRQDEVTNFKDKKQNKIPLINGSIAEGSTENIGLSGQQHKRRKLIRPKFSGNGSSGNVNIGSQDNASRMTQNVELPDMTLHIDLEENNTGFQGCSDCEGNEKVANCVVTPSKANGDSKEALQDVGNGNISDNVKAENRSFHHGGNEKLPDNAEVANRSYPTTGENALDIMLSSRMDYNCGSEKAFKEVGNNEEKSAELCEQDDKRVEVIAAAAGKDCKVVAEREDSGNGNLETNKLNHHKLKKRWSPLRAYRMHPEICQFPSLHFYDNKLMNGEQMSNKSASFHEIGVLGLYLFYDITDGQELRGKKFRCIGSYNEREAEAAVELLRFFKRRYSSEFVGGRIGIITPYKCQLSLLRSRFSSAFGSSVVADMEFNTVDGFQGREVDILILSTVRAADLSSSMNGLSSSSIGFVADVRRMNVALTRAKLSLCILGNARTLQTNRNWAALVKDVKERNLVISAKQPYKSLLETAPRDACKRESINNHSRLTVTGDGNDFYIQSSKEAEEHDLPRKMDVKSVIPRESVTGGESKGRERSEKKLDSGKKKDKCANSESSRERSEHELGDGHKNLNLSRGTKKSIEEDKPAHCCSVEGEIDGNPWYYDINNFIQNPGGIQKEKKTLRRLAIDFYLDGEMELKPETRCEKSMKGFAQPILIGMMARKMQRNGYFWKTLVKDCIDYVRKCHKCQVRGDKINAPPALMFNLISPWIFALWGMDVIGPINQKPWS
uniref:USP domain-containing protein n=1 Tax=Salix viminalis TaxID=40686 RepID=A0A6N2L6F1_SALVM